MYTLTGDPGYRYHILKNCMPYPGYTNPTEHSLKMLILYDIVRLVHAVTQGILVRKPDDENIGPGARDCCLAGPSVSPAKYGTVCRVQYRLYPVDAMISESG